MPRLGRYNLHQAMFVPNISLEKSFEAIIDEQPQERSGFMGGP